MLKSEEKRLFDILNMAVNALKEQKKKDDKLLDALSEAFDCWAMPEYHAPLDNAIIGMIETLFQDNCGEYGSTFSWWCYELDFGEKAKDQIMMWDNTGKNPIPMATVEDLFNYYKKYTICPKERKKHE